MSPIYVDPFLGAGAVWLHLLDPSLVPLVSWMGGKRKFARDILALLDLHPRDRAACVLGDASWWGWVWPVVLDPVTGPEVATLLRFWRERGDDPRALWFNLRGYGPLPSRAEAAAQLLWLQARAASGVPVWWEGDTSRMWDRTRVGNVGPMGQMHANEATAGGGARSRSRMEVGDVLDAGTVHRNAGARLGPMGGTSLREWG